MAGTQVNRSRRWCSLRLLHCHLFAMALSACGSKPSRVLEAIAPVEEPAKPVLPCKEGAVLVQGGELNGRGIESLCVDKVEVTVEQFNECVAAEGCARASTEVELEGLQLRETAFLSSYCNTQRTGRQRHPINCVSLLQAESYCRFREARLPSEEEWEWAARGREEGRAFPWGAEAPSTKRGNLCGAECSTAFAQGGVRRSPAYDEDDGFPGTADVGSFALGASRDGVLDLAGNVAEWTSTKAEFDGNIVRGGSFSQSESESVHSDARATFAVTARTPSVGLRCVAPVARPVK